MNDKKIEEIKIKNFRGIQEIEIKNCRKLNIILGKNNTCKTSILEAIEFIEEPFNIRKHGEIIARTPSFKNRWLENYLHVFRMKDLKVPIEIFIKNSESHKLEIIGEITEGYVISKERKEWEKIYENILSLRNLKQNLEQDSPKKENLIYVDMNEFKKYMLKDDIKEFIMELNILEEDRVFLARSLEREDVDLEELMVVIDQYVTEEEKTKKYRFNYNYNGDKEKFNINEKQSSFFIQRKKKKAMNIVYSNPLDYLLIENVNREIDSIIKEGYKEKIIELLKIFESDIIDFNILSNREIICNLKEGYLNIQSFGDGLKKVLVLFAKLISSKNGILLIDEIETGIHHSKIEEIYRALFDIAIKNNTQIFLTTHNLETVSAFLNILNDSLDEIQIYRIENFKNKKVVRNFPGERAYDVVIGSGGDLR